MSLRGTDARHLEEQLHSSYLAVVVLLDALKPAIQAREPRTVAVRLPRPLVQQARVN